MPRSQLPAVSIRISGYLIRLFPARFRREFGGELARVSEMCLRRERLRRGKVSFAVFLAAFLAATLRQVVVERCGRYPSQRSRIGNSFMDILRQDFRHSLRALLKSPGFALVTVVVLGLGMGSAATMLSLVDAVLIRPLPFDSPERIVALWDSYQNADRAKVRVSPFHLERWQQGADAFESLALQAPAAVTLQQGTSDPVLINGSRVSIGYFDVLGVRPFAGRFFLPEDFEASSQRTIVISHSLWLHQFQGDGAIVGRGIRLGEGAFEVIGVAPPQVMPLHGRASGSYEFGARDFFWTPRRNEQDRTSGIYGALGRLKPGVSVELARVQLRTVAANMRQAGEAREGYDVILVPLLEAAAGHVRTALWTLGAAVICVLLIAAFNVTSLVLMRADSKRREIAVRTALGAGRIRVLRQFALEGAMVAAAAGVVGLGIAYWGVRLVPALSPGEVPRLDEAIIGGRVAAVTLIMCGLCALLFAFAPALHSAAKSLADSLRQGRTSSAGGRPRLRRTLVIIEVALAVILVAGTGLLLRSYMHLRGVEPGFRLSQTLTVQLMLPRSRYPEMHNLESFYDRFLENVRSLPGVISAAAGYDHPMAANWSQSFRFENPPEGLPAQSQGALFRTVSPKYFDVLGIRLLRGRGFTDHDTADAPGAAIVNESFVRRYAQGHDPLGQRLRTPTTSWMWGDAIPKSFEIVGVVEDVRFRGPRELSEPAYYIPYRQTPQFEMTVLVRTSGRAEAILPAIRSELKRLDAALPIAQWSTMEDIYFGSVAQPRFNALLLGGFAVTALLLAMVGLWGVVSEDVRLRNQEIGIRMAVGADKSRVFRLVLASALKPVAIGILVGLPVTLAVGRLLGGLLFQVAPTDPLTFAAVPAVLLLVSIAAALPPARRASATDPIQVLRWE